MMFCSSSAIYFPPITRSQGFLIHFHYFESDCIKCLDNMIIHVNEWHLIGNEFVSDLCRYEGRALESDRVDMETSMWKHPCILSLNFGKSWDEMFGCVFLGYGDDLAHGCLL